MQKKLDDSARTERGAVDPMFTALNPDLQSNEARIQTITSRKDPWKVQAQTITTDGDDIECGGGGTIFLSRPLKRKGGNRQADGNDRSYGSQKIQRRSKPADPVSPLPHDVAPYHVKAKGGHKPKSKLSDYELLGGEHVEMKDTQQEDQPDTIPARIPLPIFDEGSTNVTPITALPLSHGPTNNTQLEADVIPTKADLEGEVDRDYFRNGNQPGTPSTSASAVFDIVTGAEAEQQRPRELSKRSAVTAMDVEVDPLLPGRDRSENGDATQNYFRRSSWMSGGKGASHSPLEETVGSSLNANWDGAIDPSLLGGEEQLESRPLSQSLSQSPSPIRKAAFNADNSLPLQNLNRRDSDFSSTRLSDFMDPKYESDANNLVSTSTRLPVASTVAVSTPRNVSEVVPQRRLSTRKPIVPKQSTEPLIPTAKQPEPHKTWCHQCRRNTQHPKMKCTNTRPDGMCQYRFCILCIERYAGSFSPVYFSSIHCAPSFKISGY